MFVYFMVGFVSSIVLALVKGWQLALICMASLPVTFIVVGVVSVVNDASFTNDRPNINPLHILRLPEN